MLASASSAAQTIRIGEMNSYKAQPAFLEPYRKGWELALEEVNAAGGVLGRRVEVISRDDNGNPGDAVRVAEELVSREKVDMLFGTFLSHVGLAVTDFAKQRKVLFLAAEPLTDKITWQNGNRYTFRLRPSTYMQVAMLVPEAAKLKKKRWALVYPNYEYGQSAAATFKQLLKAAQPDVEFVAEQAPALGRVDAGSVAQALADAKPDAIFNVLFATDLAKLRARGQHPRPVQGPCGVLAAFRRAGVPRSAARRGAGRMVGHRLSLVQHQVARARPVPERLPAQVEGVSAPGLDRRLHVDAHARRLRSARREAPTPRR